MKVYVHNKKNSFFLGMILCIVGILGFLFGCGIRSSSRKVNAAGGSEFEFRPGADLKVLEIVPYHAMASIGYLVKGEEPIDLSSPLFGSTGWFYSVGYMFTGILEPVESSKTYKNLERFKKVILKLSEEQMNQVDIDVISVTPEELNAHLDLVRNANIYFVIPRCKNNDYIKLYETINNVPASERVGGMGDDDRPNFYFRYDSAGNKISNDLSWNVVLEMFTQIAKNGKAIYLDSNAYSTYNDPPYWVTGVKQAWKPDQSEKATPNNVAKLYLMLKLMDPEPFYDRFISKSGDEDNHIKVTTEIITHPNFGFDIEVSSLNLINPAYTPSSYGSEEYLKTCRFWNPYTFLPPVPERQEPRTVYEAAGFLAPWATEQRQIIDVRGKVATDDQSRSFDYEGLTRTYADGVLPEVETFIKDRDGDLGADGKVNLDDVIAKLCGDFIKPKTPTYMTSLHVLDLEPCNTTTLTTEMVSKWTNSAIPEEKITIESMSMAEFIGKRDELKGNYDLIYFGAGVSAMNTEGGKTKYNAGDLDGLVYLHMGDSTTKSSITPNTLFYSGNDMTKLKVAELKEYLDDGYPVVITDKFYDTTGTAVNETTVDRASYVYQFINSGILASKDNMIKESNAQSKLNKVLTKPRVKIQKYAGDSSKEYQDVNGATSYLIKNGGKYDVKFKFKLINLDNFESMPGYIAPTYDVKMYCDLNCDGVYEAGEQLRSDRQTGTGDKQIGIWNVTKNSNKVLQTGGKYQLEVDTDYMLTTSINENYVGVLPYKVEIISNGTERYRTSYEGILAVKGEGSSKKKIKVLQIVASGYDDRTNTDKQKSYMDLSKLSASSDNLKNYLGKLPDYEFKFVTLTIEEFNMLYETDVSTFGSYWDEEKHKDVFAELEYFPLYKAGSTTEFRAYDNSEFAVQTATSRIENFDLIILSNDAMEDLRIPALENIIYFLKHQHSVIVIGDIKEGIKLREQAGMNRFDSPSGYDEPYKHKTSSNEKYTSEKNLKALTYSYLTSADETLKYLKDVNKNNLWSKKVTQNNAGIISRYPFNLSDVEIDVSKINGRPYQLNLEMDSNGDKKSDLNVWYCLGGSNTYSCSPNDARNNYYLYNVDGFFYSGIKDGNSFSNEGETKLFINTLYAAYRVNSYDLEFVVTNGQKLEANKYYVFVNTDVSQTFENNTENTEAYKQRVDFKIIGNPPGGGIQTVVFKDDDLTNYDIYDKITETKIPVPNYCEIGKEYYVYIEKSGLNDSEQFPFITRYGPKQGDCSLVRRNLFELQ